MVSTSRFWLRATSALRMSAARWSGRTSASAPFTLPMGVRQASTTNTELTLSYLSSPDGCSPTIRHEPAAPDSPEPPASCVVVVPLPCWFLLHAGGGVPAVTTAAAGLRAGSLAGLRVGRRRGGGRGALRRLLGQVVGDRGRDAVPVKGDGDRVGQPVGGAAQVDEGHRQPVAEERGQVVARRGDRGAEGGVLGHVQGVPGRGDVGHVLAVAGRDARRVGVLREQRLG